MRDLLDDAPCGFVTFDDNGTILLTNKRLRERLGYTERELEGRSLESILSIGGRIFYHTHFFPMLKLHGVVDEMYFSLKSNSGENFPVLANAARSERDGRAVNDCVFIRMRQRVRYEDELLRARKAAEAASEAKAKFLSMMSHDLRTPLQSISGYADLLLLDKTIDAEQREMIEAIQSAGREMLRLMNDILGFAQLESGKVTVRNDRVLIADAIARAEVLMRIRFEEAKIAYSHAECPADLAADADPDRLQQVLLNLLTNAVKFTPEGGTINVSCGRDADKVHIDVCDTGIGIAPENIGSIFEPFVQVHARYSSSHGVGLGLSISRELVRAMGGDLAVKSEFGQGSTFTITLRAA
ncbi:MAG TPA: PAS domain-containing sensor histidine kinase [Thermoanaerobaculia bacterium]|nr:PAS domain-containing sensor histidine kinase [Thermoanaerobaculia bacterium]